MCSLMMQMETGIPQLHEFDLDWLNDIEFPDSGRKNQSLRHFHTRTDSESSDFSDEHLTQLHDIFCASSVDFSSPSDSIPVWRSIGCTDGQSTYSAEEHRTDQVDKFFHELSVVVPSESGSDSGSVVSNGSEMSPLAESQAEFPDDILLELMSEEPLNNASKDSSSEGCLSPYEQQQPGQLLRPKFERPKYLQLDSTKIPQRVPNVFRRPVSSDSEDEDYDQEPRQQVSLHRDAEIEAMADYIKKVIGSLRTTKTDEVSSKLKVHEVILTVLLNHKYGDRTKDLRRILTFCDENGHELSDEGRHFKTLDTETMGLLWMKIKGNKKGNYDTFARAMRVRREKSAGYFDYLDSGKRSKKKIYRFGEKAMTEMDRMRRTLRQVSAPQTCHSEF